METLNYWLNQWYVVLVLMIWEGTWKGLSMWRAAKNDHKWWFIAIFLVNSIGILPIVYLKFYQPKAPAQPRRLATKAK